MPAATTDPIEAYTPIFAHFCELVLSKNRQLSARRQSTSVVAMSSFEVLQSRERLRVGRRFLCLRPRIAALGALGNVAWLLNSVAGGVQRAALGLAFGATISAFFFEAWWLGRRPLTERWLLCSLALTLGALGGGALLSGGLSSPFLPLMFAPVVVGFAAFARAHPSWFLLGEALLLFSLLGWAGPHGAFPELPLEAAHGMLWISATTSLALLAVGVIGLVDAHARIAAELDRLRVDMLDEAERRAASVEHLGAQVAHEVRNPLAAARGLVQLVERHVESERDKHRLAVVVSEIDRALSVLQDYLSFARPLSDLKLTAVPLLALLEDVSGVIEARAHEKHVTVRISGENVEVLADRQRLRDAVLNLALNAITALPSGGKLELSVARAHACVRLTIADDGPGISAELQRRLGQPFVSGTQGGTGLGVMLAESVTRQHGGELRFESTPGHGARALLEIPFSRAEPRARVT
jgi:signal transduction histidine kinase